jgi:phage terminase large subunit-like protein
MPTKSRPENKIDAAVALFIAISRARLMPVQEKTITYRGLRSV